MAIGLNQLRKNLTGYQEYQTASKLQFAIKANALSMARADPVFPDTSAQLSDIDSKIGQSFHRATTLRLPTLDRRCLVQAGRADLRCLPVARQFLPAGSMVRLDRFPLQGVV